jgi:hypothetical protein
MLVILLPVLATLIGLVIYGLTEGKASEAGRLLYASGALVTLFVVANHVVKL